MNIFSRKKPEKTEPDYKICSECSVCFQPRQYDDAEFVDLCSVHRKPKYELRERKKVVTYWAYENWEKLEPAAKKWQAAREKRIAKQVKDTPYHGYQSLQSLQQLQHHGRIF